MPSANDVVAVALHLDAGQVPDAARAYLGDVAAASAASANLAGISSLRLGELGIGVMDRETLCGEAKGLSGHGPTLLHLDGHGHGLFGDDDRAHTAACSLILPGGLRAVHQPLFSACYSIQLLASLLAHYKQQEAPALAAYNAGTQNVDWGLAKGDPDLFTTGKNYSKDVLGRVARFFPVK